MAMWLQHVLALSIVALSAGMLIWQGTRALSGKRGRLGSCCSKGCGAAEAPKKLTGVAFIPSEMLGRRK
jgi:hypothetical protein